MRCRVRAAAAARRSCADFIETLGVGDNTRCAAELSRRCASCRVLPCTASQLEPATAIAGNRADAAQLRWVSAAVMTAGDVLARLAGNSSGRGVGLRGGGFRVVNDASAAHVILNQVRWTEDLTVSGKIDRPVARSGTVRATLHLATADGLTGELTVEWPEGIAGSGARIRGRLGGVTVLADAPAP